MPIDNQMADAATAEIARAQIWQWLKYGARLDDGQKVTQAFFETCLTEEMKRVKKDIGAEAYAAGCFKEAIALFKSLAASKAFAPFFTTAAYRKIL